MKPLLRDAQPPNEPTDRPTDVINRDKWTAAYRGEKPFHIPMFLSRAFPDRRAPARNSHVRAMSPKGGGGGGRW